MRAELALPSIINRIREITCRTVCRSICNGNYHLKDALANLHANPTARVKLYLRRIYNLLSSFNLIVPCLHLIHQPCIPTWSSTKVSIDIEKLQKPKGSWFPHVLQDFFLNKLSFYSHTDAVHVYCDGSVNGSKSGCGLFIRDYSSITDFTDTQISKRLPNHLSSTRAELYAILEGLFITASLGRKNVYFFVDSQSAFHELISSSPTDCDIVNRCLAILGMLKSNGVEVHFTWLPSHVGIPFNEKADRLARAAVENVTVIPDSEYTFNFIKNKLKCSIETTITEQLAACCYNDSQSSLHYVHVSNLCSVTYGRQSAS